MNFTELNPNNDLQKIFDTAAPGTHFLLAPGVYRQKIEINTPGLFIKGSGADRTKIVYGDYAKKIGEDGKELVTFRTYTVAVCAKDVTMEDLTVENDSLRPEEKGQEVALTVYEDNFRASRVKMISTQDTLFLGPLPFDLTQRYEGFLKEKLNIFKPMKQIFTDCFISGTVDFIFGCGDTLFENCEIRSRVDARGGGYIAAPAHALDQKIGCVFLNCKMTADEGVDENSVFLARPWRDYGLATFINCKYGDHIKTEGFNKWNDSDRDKTARFYEDKKIEGRVPWSKLITQEEIEKLVAQFR